MVAAIDVVAGIGFALGFLLAIIGHEIAHHFVARRLGDHTPQMAGRLKWSIPAHADPLGTYILPGIFIAAAVFAAPFYLPFGWGKRHSLNLRVLRGKDPVVVLLAGPVTTLLIAVAAGLVVRASAGAVEEVAFWVAVVASTITVIEILPIPGRDGGRLLGRFLSPQASMKMEDLARYDVLFLVLLVAFPFLGSIVAGMVAPVCSAVTGLSC